METFSRGHSAISASVASNICKYHRSLRDVVIDTTYYPLHMVQIVSLINSPEVGPKLRSARERRVTPRDFPLDTWTFTGLEILEIQGRSKFDRFAEKHLPNPLLPFLNLREVTITYPWGGETNSSIPILQALSECACRLEKLKFSLDDANSICTRLSKDLLSLFHAKKDSLRQIYICDSCPVSRAAKLFTQLRQNYPELVPIMRIGDYKEWSAVVHGLCKDHLSYAIPSYDGILESSYPRPLDRLIQLKRLFRMLIDEAVDAPVEAWMRKHLVENFLLVTSAPAKISDVEIIIRKFLSVVYWGTSVKIFWCNSISDDIAEIFRTWASKDIYKLILAIGRLSLPYPSKRARALERIIQGEKGKQLLLQAVSLRTCVLAEPVAFYFIPHIECLLGLLAVEGFDVTTRGSSGTLFAVALMEHHLAKSDAYFPALEQVLARYSKLPTERIEEFVRDLCNSNGFRIFLQSNKQLFITMADCLKVAPRLGDHDEVWKQFIFHPKVLEFIFTYDNVDAVLKFVVACERTSTSVSKKIREETQNDVSRRLWNFVLHGAEKHVLTRAKYVLKVLPRIPTLVHDFASSLDPSSTVKPLLKRLLMQVEKPNSRK
jgi:hypothetical protein